MNIKQILIIIILTALSACGYKPINNSQNHKFNILDYQLDGDRQVVKILKNYFNKHNKINSLEKNYNIKSKNFINKSTTSKDKTGKATSYNLELKINLQVLENDQLPIEKTFSKSISYNNLSSQFELKQYEKILIKNLTNQIISEINYFLSNI